MTSNKVAVFHHISDEKKDFHNSIEQILAFDGQITFDGIYNSVWEYREALRNKGAILFVSANSELDYNKIFELWTKYGFQVGWHTATHPDLTKLTDNEVRAEIGSDFATDLFAYPFGEYDCRVIELVKEAGYKKAYSTTQGEEGNDFAIPRVYL